MDKYIKVTKPSDCPWVYENYLGKVLQKYECTHPSVRPALRGKCNTINEIPTDCKLPDAPSSVTTEEILEDLYNQQWVIS